MEKKMKSLSATLLKFFGAAVILAVLTAIGAYPRFAREREAAAAVNESPVTHLSVSTVRAGKGQPTSELLLPGNIQPLYSANLYGRVDGYLDRRNVDIGARVKAGDVLAVINSPEIDQQLLQASANLQQADAALLQAKASLEQANANAELARLTKERDIPLGEQHAISQQNVDSAVQSHNARVADVSSAKANIAAAEATVTANRANVSRLQQMQSFEHIVAPFDGVITERNVERGDLVSASPSSAGKPLFAIAQSGTLRIQVDVPQSEAVNIHDGQRAAIEVKERLGRSYTGVVTRSASSLDSAARTMLTEVQVENRDGSLLPGMYAQVKFTLPQPRTSLIIPTSSLVVDHAGMHVVSVDAGHNVHFLPVTLGKNMGIQIEILAGLRGSEDLVASPSDLLNEGAHVEIH
jgi:RND family efflux transporter MFP subunit